VATRFAGAGWRSAALVEAARIAPDFYLDALVQVHMRQWTSGRVALIGDAACCPSPLTGLGTSLALVGAYVLAGELITTRDLDSAFGRYEELVRPYVTLAQKLPPGGTRTYAPMSALAIRTRVLSTRLMVSRPFRPLAKKAFFSKADAIELPSYSILDAVFPSA
jgi:2-polyprenyl-6-methoxyphenol hydroxylase-like FAD-dependent oxidoreductase